MKRSEMIVEISNWLLVHCPDEYNNQSSYSRKIDAEDLLGMLEQTGMKAPVSLFQAKHGQCLCTMRESCSTCGGWLNEWEPE